MTSSTICFSVIHFLYLYVLFYILWIILVNDSDHRKEHHIWRQKTCVWDLLLLIISCETLGNSPDPTRLSFFTGETIVIMFALQAAAEKLYKILSTVQMSAIHIMHKLAISS